MVRLPTPKEPEPVALKIPPLIVQLPEKGLFTPVRSMTGAPSAKAFEIVRLALPLICAAICQPRVLLAPESPALKEEAACTEMTPVTVKTALSPVSILPPLRIRPALPLTPGKSKAETVTLARISDPVSKVRESPGNVWMPPAVGLRMRVGPPPAVHS